MKRGFCIFMLTLAGIFILVHAAIPHHHHWDAIFLESQDTHHHPGGEDELDEIMVFAYTKPQPVKIQQLLVPVSLFLPEITIPEPILCENFLLPAIYQKSFYHSIVSSSHIGRGPPALSLF